MIGSRCSPVPLDNKELCDNKNFRLIIMTINAGKTLKCLSGDFYRKINSAMQIDMGPSTHGALLKLTFKLEVEFWWPWASQIHSYM